MYKLFAEDEILSSMVAFVPQYVPSNGAVSLEPSYILRNIPLQLGILSSLKFNETTYALAIEINHEQYCQCGSVAILGVGCDWNEPLGPDNFRRQSKIAL